MLKPLDFSLKIPLLGKSEPLVAEGKKVSVGQLLARVDRQSFVEVEVDPACRLEVALGMSVVAGQVLAKSGKFWQKRKVISPCSGKVEAFLGERRVLRIASVEKPLEIFSPVAAKIAKIEADFLTLKFAAVVLPAVASWGKSGWGNLRVFAGEIYQLQKAKEQIILLKKLTPAILNKLEALGAAGAVCLETRREGIGKEVDDSGVLVLAEKDFQKASEYEGKRAKVDVNDKRLIIAI
jgi:hypothetical protein